MENYVNMSNLRSQMRYLNPYEIHKIIINEYVLKRSGDTKSLERDSSKDRTDYHVIKENHKFLWDEDKKPETWEEQFAKKYYDKLFKEYCIADLSRYKENKVALRWRIEKEVVSGKGQFICGNKFCSDNWDLRSWEVNFAYQEEGKRKNALIKIRLCPSCSKKLNHHSTKREVKRLKKEININEKKTEQDEIIKVSEVTYETTNSNTLSNTKGAKEFNTSPWEEHKPIEVKSREEEMEDYLQELLI